MILKKHESNRDTSPRRLSRGILVILPLIACLIGQGCDKNKNKPGYDYFPDMAYSHAYKTWTENPVHEDGITMRTPPPGTIPREMVPFPYQKSLEEMERAGKELANPVPLTSEAVARGAEVFKIYCINCHGEKGDGLGYLYTSGKYPYPPASLVNERVINLPDGAIYHSITMGYGIMGAHGPLVRPIDRWNVIHYIRRDLQEQ